MDLNVVVPIKRIGVPDILVEHATPDESLASLGLTSDKIADTVRNAFFSEKPVAVGV